MVTSARLPITAPCPTRTPGMIIASEPIHTSLPMTVSPAPRNPSRAPAKAATSGM